MKTKLLALGVIVLDFLIAVYVIEMKHGWLMVWKLIGAMGLIFGGLFGIIVTVWAISTLMDDGSNGW